MLLASLAIVLFLAVSGQDPASSAECSSWSTCRDAALAAESRRDFEGFHDLAWRAIQKGPRNHPELMQMLARAQSSSGRPLDAMVMLKRVAELGVTPDISAEGFARVRALPAWAELERQLAAGMPAAAAAPPSAAPSLDEEAPIKIDAPAAAARAEAGAPAAETLRFTAPAFTPAGLAYDAVSRRFIVGDRRARKLAVVDEFSHQVANLAGAGATGFGEIAAIEIDAREGNLWVVTAEEPGASAGTTTLHKLQLISGRALAAFTPAGDAGPARLADVAVTQGTVLSLDAAGRRLYRLRPGGRALELAASLGTVRPLSLAPAPGDVVYVSHEDGIQRVELASGDAAAVASDTEVPLAGLARIRWYGHALVGVQRTGAGGYRAVRLKLSRNGRSVTGIEVLDPAIEAASPEATCISGDGLFYLVPGGSSEMVVRRVELKRQ